MGVLRRGAIDVVLTWGEPIPFDETSDRKAVARALEASVRRQMAAALRGRAAAELAPLCVRHSLPTRKPL